MSGAASTMLTLGDLLGSTPVALFLADYWDQQSFHVARDNPSFYDALLPADAIDHLIRTGLNLSVRARSKPFIELVGGAKSAGRVHLRDAVDTLDHLSRAYGEGATVLVQMAQHYWPPLWALSADVEKTLRCPVDATLIQTPPDSQAFGRHIDRLGSIVIQIRGRKSWRMFERTIVDPVPDLPLLPFETVDHMSRERLGRLKAADRGSVAVHREVVLSPGDLLYVPRGMPHEVWTEGEGSTHITLAVKPVTYLDLLVAALGRRAIDDPALRSALPPGGYEQPSMIEGCARTIVAAAVRGLDIAGALADLQGAVDAAHGTETTSPPCAPAKQEALSAETMLSHVAAEPPEVIYGREQVEFYYGDRLFRLPTRAGAALEFIARSRQFRVRDIPGLTDGSQLTLARRLVRANVLRAARQGDTSEFQPKTMETMT